MDEAGYAVYYSSSETYFSSADKIYAGKDVTSARVTVKEIYNNYTYYFKVAAYDSNNKEGACSEIKSMKFQLATAPENIKGEMQDETSIKLSWDAVESADCYNVYNSKDVLLATVKDTDFVVTGLEYMKEYTFKVETENIYGIISEKAEVDAVTFPSVQNVKVQAKKDGNNVSYTVSWDNISESDVTYTVYFKNDTDANSYSTCIYDATSSCTKETSVYSYIQVKATKSGLSSYSSLVNVVFPDEVTNIKGESTDTTVKLSWTAADGTTAYNIYKRISSSGTKTLVTTITDVSKTEYTVESLLSGTVYYFWVESVNADGNSTMSDYEYFSTLMKAPANVTATATDNFGELTITYGSVTDAYYYYIYVNTENTIPEDETESVLGETSCTLTGLENGTQYYVWVRIKTATGVFGAYSEAVTATTKDFGTPANVTVSATSNPGELSISFDAVTDADSYYVYVNTEDVKPVTYKTSLTTNNGVVTGLEYNKEYYVWIRAYNSTSMAHSAYSEAVTATTKGLGVTQNVTVEATTNLCQLSVSFDSVAGADEYYVYVSETTTKPMSYTKFTTNSGNVSVGKNNTEYYVWVKAHNSTFNVNGAYSEVATGTTRVFTVPTFYADEPGLLGTSGSIDLKSISYLSCTDKLIVEFSLTSDFATIEMTSSISPKSSTTIYGLKSDTYYYVRMKAYDAETDTYSDYSAVSGDRTE